MGNFLKVPLTEKQTSTGSGNGLDYGLSSMQGWRASMEDTHTVVESIPGFILASFFAVFDGHGGSMAAEYSSAEIMKAVTSTEGFGDNLNPTQIGKSLQEAFLTVDANLYSVPQMASGQDHSGCTAICSFVTPNHIIVANAGDSRAVLGKNQQTVPMSFDHKPFDELEKARIEKASGIVRNKRVNGDLAVSRALGDFVYKDRHDLTPSEQKVSPFPDVKVEERDGTEEFLVIACDGIWDVMSNDDICEFIRRLLSLGETDLGLMAEELLDHCLEIGSRDNMSAVIVAFPGIKYGSGSGVQGLRDERAKALENEKNMDPEITTPTVGTPQS